MTNLEYYGIKNLTYNRSVSLTGLTMVIDVLYKAKHAREYINLGTIHCLTKEAPKRVSEWLLEEYKPVSVYGDKYCITNEGKLYKMKHYKGA